MENIKVGCIPVRQAVKINTRKLNVKQFLKKNKIGLIFSFFFLTLFSIYGVLIFNFINLIKILN